MMHPTKTLICLYAFCHVVTSLDSNITSNTNISNQIILSSPEHVGAAHYQIIHGLQESIREKIPENEIEYLHAISIELRKAACHDEDIICNSRIVRKTIEVQPGLPQGQQIDEIDMISHLPENFDGKVANSIQDLMMSTVLADLDNPTEIVQYMNENFESIKHNDAILSDSDREIGLIAYSVGMESAKQWAEILKDPENPFSLISNHIEEGNHNRKLQFAGVSDEALQISFVNILQADILGSVSGAIESVFDSEKTILQFAMEEASVASMKSFGVNFVGSSLPDISGLSSLSGMGNLAGLTGGNGNGIPNNFNGNIQECDFPNTFWCDEQPPPVQQEIDEDCLFPNSPMFKDCDQESLNAMNEGQNGPIGGFFAGGNGQMQNGNFEGGNGQGMPPGGPNGGGFFGGGNPALPPLPNGGSPGSFQTGGGPPGGGGGSTGTLGGNGNGPTITGVPNAGVLGNLLNPCAVPDSPLCAQATASGNPFSGINNLPPVGSMNGSGGGFLPPMNNGPGSPNGGGNIPNNGNGDDNTLINNEKEEWTDDDKMWSDPNILENKENLDASAKEPENPDCPFPGEPRCGRLIEVTANDGTTINCKTRSSPLCQMAMGTFKEASGIQVQLPSQPRQKEP